MGFLDERKIYLSTRSATSISDGFDSAKWILKTPMSPPNENYKMRVQLSAAFFPNTYDRLSSDTGSDTLTLLYHNGTDWKDAADSGQIVKVKLLQSYHSGGLEVLSHIVQTALTHAMDTPDLVDEIWKPMVKFTEKTGAVVLMLHDYRSNDLDARQNPVPTDDTLFNFKLLTPHDLSSFGITPDTVSPLDVNLSSVLGWSRVRAGPVLLKSDFVPPVVKDSSFEITSDAVKQVVRADRQANTIGTQFIKIRTNLNVKNVDPNSLEQSRILTCIPVSDSSDVTQTVSFFGSVQHPQYFTLGQRSIDNIELSLLDDQDKPVRMHGDWYVELSVSMEEPERMDMYRGTASFTGPVLDFHASGDPGGYAKLQSELEDARGFVEMEETANRNSHPFSYNKRSRLF